MKTYFILILFLGIISCTNTQNNSDDITIDQDYFSKAYEPFLEEDIHTLNSLLIFFDSLVMKRSGVSFPDSAYHCYMENIRYKDSYLSIINELNKDKPKVDSFLLEIGSSSVFPRIFHKSYFYANREMTDTVGYIYNPNFQSSYMILLKAAVTTDSTFSDYAKSLAPFGGTIPPSVVSGYQHSHPELDLLNDTIRLVTAIHYISLISETLRN